MAALFHTAPYLLLSSYHSTIHSWSSVVKFTKNHLIILRIS